MAFPSPKKAPDPSAPRAFGAPWTFLTVRTPGGGGGGTPLYGLYGDVPLDRVWFLASSALNRVYNFMRTCPRQGLNLS